MTMFPPQNLSKQRGYGYVYGYGGVKENIGLMSRLERYECYGEDFLGSDHLAVDPMAEDESRTETSTINEAGSSSKEEVQDEGWLQLGIGPTGHDQRSPGGLIELDLISGGTTSQLQVRSLAPNFFDQVPHEIRAPPTPLFFQGGTSTSTSFPHQQTNWAFRPMSMIPQNITASSLPLTSLVAPGSFFTRPIQLHAGIDAAAAPSLDFRVVDPPPRPHSGIWFMLHASQNQSKEPFLPQIQKSYLRIKDGRMTVRLLMKYLVNKLELDTESEIEIRCRGQELLPFLTLQHVRDYVWSPRDAVTLLPDSSTTDHVMVLHYGRTASTS